jgi:hypothetical protein
VFFDLIRQSRCDFLVYHIFLSSHFKNTNKTQVFSLNDFRPKEQKLFPFCLPNGIVTNCFISFQSTRTPEPSRFQAKKQSHPFKGQKTFLRPEEHKPIKNFLCLSLDRLPILTIHSTCQNGKTNPPLGNLFIRKARKKGEKNHARNFRKSRRSIKNLTR